MNSEDKERKAAKELAIKIIEAFADNFSTSEDDFVDMILEKFKLKEE